MIYRDIANSVLSLPFFVGRYVSLARHGQLYLPSREDLTTLSLDEIKSMKNLLLKTVAKTEEIGCKLSINNIKEVLWDLPRHDSFNYINNGSLTESFFEQAEASLSDPHLYLIISNTGSAVWRYYTFIHRVHCKDLS